MERDSRANRNRSHVLVLSYPSQGHINPILQFSKRLAYKGLKVTLAVTVFIAKSIQTKACPIPIETISDGFDENGVKQAESDEAYFTTFKTVGSRTLAELIEKHQSSGDPLSCVVYDSFLPWALDVAKSHNLVGASFFTQSAAVNSIYYHVQRGLLEIPVAGPAISVPELPAFEISELPSFVASPESMPCLLTLLLNQFIYLEKADWVLVNTFDKLEIEVVDWTRKVWPIKTIGPTLPSGYLDKRVEGDHDYGFSIFKPSSESTMDWLNKREARSVVYVSFGSIAALTPEQMEEIAWGLKDSNMYFLWVVRETEENKLPSNFSQETSEKGLVVTWCPQLEVLSHEAVGCFVTHCGWNSTLEALSLGVPMVALPHWSDQPTNAKCIEQLWKMGLRPKVDEENGVSGREEIEACIREVMEGEKGKLMRRNASKWKESAKEALDEGGSSDNNIEEFVTELLSM